MKVIDILNDITNNSDYFPNSLYLKSEDDKGCVYKWLSHGAKYATRREIFIAFNENDTSELEQKEVIDYIEVTPAE